MNVTRLSDAPDYVAAAHYDVATKRLQGLEAGNTEHFWVGVSRYHANGRAEKALAPAETVYVVLDGELVVTTEEGETVLGRLDSMHLAKGEGREIQNRSGRAAVLLVTMAHTQKEDRHK